MGAALLGLWGNEFQRTASFLRIASIISQVSDLILGLSLCLCLSVSLSPLFSPPHLSFFIVLRLYFAHNTFTHPHPLPLPLPPPLPPPPLSLFLIILSLTHTHSLSLSSLGIGAARMLVLVNAGIRTIADVVSLAPDSANISGFSSASIKKTSGCCCARDSWLL